MSETYETEICIDDLPVEIEYSIFGKHCRATMESPEEFPEVEIEHIWTFYAIVPGEKKVIDLVDIVGDDVFDRLREDIADQAERESEDDDRD